MIFIDVVAIHIVSGPPGIHRPAPGPFAAVKGSPPIDANAVWMRAQRLDAMVLA